MVPEQFIHINKAITLFRYCNKIISDMARFVISSQIGSFCLKQIPYLRLKTAKSRLICRRMLNVTGLCDIL